MCKECKKLIELYAETQLECVRFNKIIARVIRYECPTCGESVFVAADISDNNFCAVDMHGMLNTEEENNAEM